MSFSEQLKLDVKKRADFTCCWCKDRQNKVEVHHIIPQAGGGPDTDDNAAPLCGSCHALYGGNPNLRKEIKSRRDHWYEICAAKRRFQLQWPVGSDVPLLDFHSEVPPSDLLPIRGIQFTDKDPATSNIPPVIRLTLHNKTTFLLGDIVKPLETQDQKWLYIRADLWSMFGLRIQVKSQNMGEVFTVEHFLRTGEGICGIKGIGSEYIIMWQEDSETRLQISSNIPRTDTVFTVHARLSHKSREALANYLDEMGYFTPFRES